MTDGAAPRGGGGARLGDLREPPPPPAPPPSPPAPSQGLCLCHCGSGGGPGSGGADAGRGLSAGSDARPRRLLPRLPVALIMTVIPFCYMTRPIDSIFPFRSSRAEFYVYNSLNKRQSMKQHVPANPVSSEFFFFF